MISMGVFRFGLLFTMLLSFVAALFLTVLPMPQWAIWFRPEWVLLVLLFWCYRTPEWVGAGIAFLLGLSLDCLYGSVLGLHSVALVLMVYLMSLLQRTMRVQGLFMQMIVILFIAVAYQCSLLMINALLKQQVPHFWAYWAPAMTSSLLWPWLNLLLEGRVGRAHGRG